MLGTFGIAIGEGVGLVQIRQNLDGILLGAQISEHPVKGFLDVQRAYLDLVAIKGHQVRLYTKCAGLV